MSPPKKSTNRIQKGFVINGRFEITRKLGEGGFALVFEGKDVSLDRQVAIKVLHGALTGNANTRDNTVLERFTREAQLAATVEHDAIVKIYDVGEIDGIDEPFIVMEYLRGKSLQEYIDEEGALEATKLLPLFQNLLIGLGFAHEAGIVHKDLKPDNIFYRYPDSIRESFCVVDFGIAHIGRGNSQRFTGDGEFFGTPSYMAPEYITDQTVSPRVDVYQMGLVLIECLTGHPFLFHENAMANLLMHLHRNLPLPKPLADSPLGPILERAIAMNPLERYADAMEFAEALASVRPEDVPDKQTLAAARAASSEAGESLAEKGDTSELRDELKEHIKLAQRGHEAEEIVAPFQTTLQASGTNEPHGHFEERTAQTPTLTASEQPTFDSLQLKSYPTEEVTLAASNPAQKRKDRVIITALFCAILLAIAIVVALVMNKKEPDAPKEPIALKDSATKTPASQNKKLSETQLAALKKSSETAQTSPKEKTPPTKTKAQEPPTLIVVEVITRPTGAEVLQGRKFLGETPLTLEFKDAKESRKLTLRKKGYKNEEITVSSQDHPDVTYLLAKRERTSIKKAVNVEDKGKTKPETKVEPSKPPSTILLPSIPKPSKIVLPK